MLLIIVNDLLTYMDGCLNLDLDVASLFKVDLVRFLLDRLLNKVIIYHITVMPSFFGVPPVISYVTWF